MNNPNILIIEDNPISRKVLRVTLESENYSVIEAADAHTGLQAAMKDKFDLIIQDIFLPDMNGFELNNKLRKIPGVEETPIIAISGFQYPIDKGLDLSGITEFIMKPIDPSYLLEVIKIHIPLSVSTKILIGSGKHVLIVDDNPIDLKLFCLQLKNLGFEVTPALDGVIALHEALLKKPDIIISDILMPNMDGFGLCIEIKRNPELCDIPVMLLTSHYLDDEDISLANKVGASYYLTTPADEGKLGEAILQIIKENEIHTKSNLLKLTDEIKEKHAIRSVQQLDQQVVDNSKLAQRCAILTSQLSLTEGIVNALASSKKDMDESLKEVLYFSLDSMGLSKGALYLRKQNNEIVLNQLVGYSENQINDVKSCFGLSAIIPDIILENKPFAIPPDHVMSFDPEKVLALACVKSALFIPLFSGYDCLGILYLGSDSEGIAGGKTKELVHTLSLQFGQSIALASAFDKLIASENRYRQLVEISPDAIFIQQNNKYIYANSSALKLFNTDNIEILAERPFLEYFLYEYQDPIKEKMVKITRKKITSFQEGKIIDIEGEIHDVEIVLSPFVYNDSPAVYIIMRDITERNRSALHLEIQYAIAWILAESATLFDATAKILKLICERLKWDCGSIWAVDKKANVLRCTRCWQISEISNTEFQKDSLKLTCPIGEGFPGQAWKNRKILWKTDVINDNEFLRPNSGSVIGLKTGVIFPIIYENEVLGVIEFYSRETSAPNVDLMRWFESIGNQLGLFLVRKHLEKQMLFLAEHDTLTGLSNRSLLEQYLNTAIISAEESSRKLAVLFIDIDHFKYINDSMGHEAGDLLLKEIAERFRRCLRPEDSVSRLGGDEFVIIVNSIFKKEEVIVIIERLQKQLSHPIILKDKEFNVKASIGISVFPDDARTVQTLIQKADIAMYAAKEKGRNNYQFCTSEMTVHAENRGILINNLRKALVNNEFALHYQPKINIKNQCISGMEALIRWNSPDGLLMPANFIPAAEGSDLIVPIGEWVLIAACHQNKVWQRACLADITISINLSVQNLNNQLLQVMKKTLSETQIQPDSIEVELTEAALIENVENNIIVLSALKSMGVKIAIDDFGTGYSSLSYLKRFPIDTIKIDQSFVRDLATDPDDAAIVTAIIAMAHSLGISVNAEGVETEDQLKFLCENGCDEIQGYYFSRPLSAEEATSYIQNPSLVKKFNYPPKS